MLVCAIALVVATWDRLRAHDPPKEWLVDHVQQIDSELEGVDPSDGIDADEAKAIAEVFRGRYVSGCGAADEATLDGNTWTVSLRLGFVGKKSDRTIQVDARSGAVWGLGGPRYPDFRSFRYGVLIEIARNGH